ncbi:MAG: hypothetical protein IT258_16740 [Saprospiraceae bacterium]|nr:hypothetical protein [Saprospiraceae bacterium]
MAYTIIETTKANTFVFVTHKKEAKKSIETTTYVIYELVDGKAILIPYSSATSAVFDNLSECLIFVENVGIDEIRTGNVFEQLKERIRNIEKDENFFIQHLGKELQYDVVVTNSIPYLLKLNTRIMRYGKKKAGENLYVFIGIYLCLVIKLIVDGKWMINEKNTNTQYNFYVPVIKDDFWGEYHCWKDLADSFYGNKKFDIVEFLKHSLIRRNRDIIIADNALVKYNK